MEKEKENTTMQAQLSPYHHYPVFQPSDTEDDLPLLLALASPSDDAEDQNETEKKIYLICLHNEGERYRLTDQCQDATHYAFVPAGLQHYLEYTWAIYANRDDGWSREELRHELNIDQIKKVVKKRLHVERELDDLVSFAVRFDRKQLMLEEDE